MKRYNCWRCGFHTNSIRKWNIHSEWRHNYNPDEEERLDLLERAAIIRQDMKELSQDETVNKIVSQG